MLSSRCNGLNLLNYLKQKQIDYEINFEELKKNEDIKWNVIFIFNKKKYSLLSDSKKEGLNIILDNCNDLIHDYIKTY